MLSCKDFVQQSGKIIDNEHLSFTQRMSNKIHMMLCSHCRKYLQQAQIITAVANNIEAETACEQDIDNSVQKMKEFT